MAEVGTGISAETPKILTGQAVRPIRDVIETRIRELISEVAPAWHDARLRTATNDFWRRL